MSSHTQQAPHLGPERDRERWQVTREICTGFSSVGTGRSQSPGHDSIDTPREHMIRTAKAKTRRTGTLKHRRTHTNTCNVSSCPVQERHHMTTLGHSTLKAGIEGVARKERQGGGKACKLRVLSIIVNEGLKARGSPDGFS